VTINLAIHRYGSGDAPQVRSLLLDVHAEVYADLQDDPFMNTERFAEALDGWGGRPGWSCVVGYDGDQAVGYAYGAPLPSGARWWRGLLTETPPEDIIETGVRTFALSELMVRVPWRKTGVSRSLHDALLRGRPEERATLLVEKAHPRVRALYESWGWRWFGDLRPRIPHAPVFDALVLQLG
jgi:hypothetical protein